MKKLLIIPLLLISIILSYSPAYNKNIRITSYHPNDSTKSSKCTASGYCTKDFILNDEGIYTYQGKIVIATPTYECTKKTDGACGKYNSLPKNYHQYNFYDELTLHFNEKEYEAIVLDICGACYWEEDKQRYDIFVEDKKSVIDTDGTVFIKSQIKISFIFSSIILIILLFVPFKKKRISKILKNTKFCF